MGIRKEWKNEQNSIIGIDICKFDSGSTVSKACDIQGRNTFSTSFNLDNLDNLDSLKSIITEWQENRQYGYSKNIFSVVGVKGNTAVHVYFFDPIEIDTNYIFSIVEELSIHISDH